MLDKTKEKMSLENMQVRPFEMEDVDELFELYTRYAVASLGSNDNSKENFVSSLQSPSFNIDEDTLLISEQGKIVAAMIAFARSETPVHPFIKGAVHPEHEGRGLGTALFDWAEKRSRKVESQVPADARISMRTEFGHGHKASEHLMNKMGFERIRQEYRMIRRFDTRPVQPEALEGFTFRIFDEEKDLERIFWAIEHSFKDHFGFVPSTLEVGLPRFRHAHVEDHAYDPELWQIAEVDGQVAGYLIGRKESYDDPECGHVSWLGVLRPWRGKGLASYMLKQTIYEQYYRGKDAIDLHVDAGSLTGALRLYKNVGMQVDKVYDSYEKELRPGKELSIVTLDGQ